MSEWNADKPTVLLVEVDEETRENVMQMLQRAHFSVIAVEGEEEARIMVEQGRARPDVIVINMNDSTGDVLEAGRRIRECAGVDSGVPVVVIPNDFDNQFEGEDVPTGDGDYLCYWADPQQLENLLRRLAEARHA